MWSFSISISISFSANMSSVDCWWDWNDSSTLYQQRANDQYGRQWRQHRKSNKNSFTKGAHEQSCKIDMISGLSSSLVKHRMLHFGFAVRMIILTKLQKLLFYHMVRDDEINRMSEKWNKFVQARIGRNIIPNVLTSSVFSALFWFWASRASFKDETSATSSAFSHARSAKLFCS